QRDQLDEGQFRGSEPGERKWAAAPEQSRQRHEDRCEDRAQEKPWPGARRCYPVVQREVDNPEAPRTREEPSHDEEGDAESAPQQGGKRLGRERPNRGAGRGGGGGVITDAPPAGWCGRAAGDRRLTGEGGLDLELDGQRVGQVGEPGGVL